MGLSLKKLFGGGSGGGGGISLPKMADPTEFYTPEMQQAILDALAQDAETGRQQDQAAISGQAITSGFGVGNTSREATRRAKADANALDQIVNGYIDQAAQIEDMRTQQRETTAIRKAGVEDFRARQSARDRADRQDLLSGGIGAITNIAGQKLGSFTKRASSSPTAYDDMYADPYSNFSFSE